MRIFAEAENLTCELDIRMKPFSLFRRDCSEMPTVIPDNLPSKYRKAVIGLVAAVGFAWLPKPVEAWSLGTHLWIAQEVLNDALDGEITLAGRTYSLPPNVAAALRAHPERYRMGSLGPDVFPDPVAGQVTVHPGVDNGWQTDQWLRHLLNGASNAEATAFSYGFVAHAAGDIFAHTYVNAYAGNIFQLTDGEREVELRHFLLEKYIESRTPPVVIPGSGAFDARRDLGTATSFLRDRLLLDGDVSRQFLRAPMAQHLATMHAMHLGVRNLDDGTQALISQLTTWAADYYKLQADLVTGVAQARLAVTAAEVSLDAANVALEVKRRALELQLQILAEARDIVKNNPELITHQANILILQIRIAADLAANAVSTAANAANAIASLQNSINNIQDQIANAVCDLLGDWCHDLYNDISNLYRRIDNWREIARIANQSAIDAANLRDEIRNRLTFLQNQLHEATKGIADGVYEANVAIARAELAAAETVLRNAEIVVAQAKELVERLSKELDAADLIIDQIKAAVDRYNLITVLIRNWITGIEVAAEEYIKSGHEAGLLMLQGTGSPLDEYSRWLQCYGGVLTGVPYQGAQAGCFVMDELDRIRAEFDKFIDDLPPLLRWLIFPTREAQREAMRRLQPEIDKAKLAFLTFLTDQRTAEFILLLTNPQNASRDRLIEAFQNDGTGQGLLRFPNVADLVDRDLGAGAHLDPQRFAPLAHSVTMAKLALLGPHELNRLIRDLAGPYVSPRYGASVYPTYPGNFTLLLDVVRSIDGNHQWQAYGLPYPRARGSMPTSPAQVTRNHYGHDHRTDPRYGLRIWVDPYLRDRVFLRLFPAPVLGALTERRELRPGMYAFADCPANPFPATQNPISDVVQLRDPSCDGPAVPFQLLEFNDAAEYSTRYHQCSTPTLGERHWTLAASMRTRQAAELIRDRTVQNFPDMAPQVWAPQGRNRYWTVMLASCTSADRAAEVRALAIRRGIARDSYVWRERAPWRPYP